jgi:hypothetical protein
VGKLGHGFMSLDELQEIDMGDGDKPRPTYISKKIFLGIQSRVNKVTKRVPRLFCMGATWDAMTQPIDCWALATD